MKLVPLILIIGGVIVLISWGNNVTSAITNVENNVSSGFQMVLNPFSILFDDILSFFGISNDNNTNSGA